MAQKDWSYLSEEQRLPVQDLVKEHNELFILAKVELCLIKQEPAHILIEDTTPWRSPLYKNLEKAKEIIGEILEDPERRDIIESPQRPGYSRKGW